MGQPRGLGIYQLSNIEEELKAQTLGFGSAGNWSLRGARVWESELSFEVQGLKPERFWNQRGFCLRNY